MIVRGATEADADVLRELWEEFEGEVPEPPHRGEVTFARDWDEIREIMASGLALIAEDGQGPAGYALAKLEEPAICFLDTIYVRPRVRRQGVAKALLAEVASWGAGRGAQTMTLEVLTTNTDGRAVYDRLGFQEESHILFAPLRAVAERVVARPHGASFGSIHVQTDDAAAVARAVTQFVPRLPGGSRGSVVVPPRNGWTGVHDELCDREPAMLRRLALELSDRMGAVVLTLGVEDGAVVRYVLFERGSVVDEYASVPEFRGPLPPGDVVALGANPTVLSRLTGAHAARIREIARTAARPEELPPARELLAAIADVIGVEGAEQTYAEAREESDGLALDRVV